MQQSHITALHKSFVEQLHRTRPATVAGRLRKFTSHFTNSPAFGRWPVLISIPVKTSLIPWCLNLKGSLAKCLCVRGDIPVTGCSSNVVNYLISLATLVEDFSFVCTCTFTQGNHLFAYGICFVVEEFIKSLNTFLTNITTTETCFTFCKPCILTY